MAKIYFEKLNDDLCDIIKKPTPSIMAAPEWWKKDKKMDYTFESDFPKDFPHRDFATIRSCPAINDSFNFGYTVFFPVDIFIDATNEDMVTWKVPNIDYDFYKYLDFDKFIGAHIKQQLGDFRVDESFHKDVLKINPMFGIKTEKGYSVLITQPFNRHDLPFKIVDAVVDTDKFATRFPYAFFIKKNHYGIIKAGTPFLQVIPFKREDFESEFVEKDLKDIASKHTIINSVFSNGYKKYFWSRKKFL